MSLYFIKNLSAFILNFHKCIMHHKYIILFIYCQMQKIKEQESKRDLIFRDYNIDLIVKLMWIIYLLTVP